MKPLGILALAAQFAPRFLSIGRGTWLAIGLGLLTLFILLIWAALALFGWFWGQGKALTEGAPEAVRAVVSQVEQAVPGARETLGDLVPALKPEPPPRDVSGFDVGPVARYPGLSRSHWHRDSREVTARYEGRADYVAVLAHYTQAFAAQGYAQHVVSATPEGEAHDYHKDGDRVRFKIAQLPQGKVKATIVAVLPAPNF
jgi:hypothetical protein